MPNIDLIGGASVETTASTAAIDRLLACDWPAGTRVYITYLPTSSPQEIVAAAVRVRRAGLVPVPHISARMTATAEQLDDYLASATGEAAVDQVMLIGGDAERPLGPYASALEVLQTGLLQRRGIAKVSLAAYPEGHPQISQEALDEALQAKLALLRAEGLQSLVVTQMCFEAEPILAWIDLFGRAAQTAPVQVGLAGIASVASLVRYAVMCGVGPSIRALSRQPSLGRLLTDTGPDKIVRALAEAAPPQVAGLHLFLFGAPAKTADWLRSVRA